MRDEKKFQCGDPIKGQEPRFFLGAAANPFADPFDFRPYRLAKKAKAGADFIQTQLIYNVPKFAEFMRRVVDLGFHEKCYILAGVAPIRSVGAAKYMATKVPGMEVDQEYIERMTKSTKGLPTPKEIETMDPKEAAQAKKARKEATEAEGIQICVEVINACRRNAGRGGRAHHGHRVGGGGRRDRQARPKSVPNMTRHVSLLEPCGERSDIQRSGL